MIPATTPLVDQRGAAFSFEALRGHPVVVTFVSARCHDACPLINAQIGEAAARARAMHSPLRFVTITLDPKRDSIFTMASLARTFDADATNWQLVSGRASAVDALMHRFKVETQNDRSGAPVAHTTFVYILDRNGHWSRTILPSSNLSSTLEEIAQ